MKVVVKNIYQNSFAFMLNRLPAVKSNSTLLWSLTGVELYRCR